MGEGMMAREIPMPTDPEERAWRARWPEAYEAGEQLGDAYENHTAAMDELLNAIGVTLRAVHEPLFRNAANPERLAAARARIQETAADWADAVARCDELLARLDQEGGE
jgi:hypothetical protein